MIPTQGRKGEEKKSHLLLFVCFVYFVVNLILLYSRGTV